MGWLYSAIDRLNGKVHANLCPYVNNLTKPARLITQLRTEPEADPLALLPLMLLAGSDREVKETLWALAKPDPQRDAGWLVTPALGFLVRRALAEGQTEDRPEDLPEDLREAILYAVMDLVEGQAQRYAAGQASADRAHCLELTDTAVQMVIQLAHRPHYMRHRVLGFVIRIYGLSRQFWQRLAATSADLSAALPEELDIIRAAFDQLQAAARDPLARPDLVQDLDQALDLFTRWDMKWSQKTGQSAKVYPKPLKGYENGEAPEFYRSV